MAARVPKHYIIYLYYIILHYIILYYNLHCNYLHCINHHTVQVATCASGTRIKTTSTSCRRSGGPGTSIHQCKLGWDAATMQLAHGHNYDPCKCPCASCMLFECQKSNVSYSVWPTGPCRPIPMSVKPDKTRTRHLATILHRLPTIH